MLPKIFPGTQTKHARRAGTKVIINIKTITKKKITYLNINDIEETDSSVLSDSFNKSFTTVAEKVESKIVPTYKKYTDYLTNPSDKTFF